MKQMKRMVNMRNKHCSLHCVAYYDFKCLLSFELEDKNVPNRLKTDLFRYKTPVLGKCWHPNNLEEFLLIRKRENEKD